MRTIFALMALGLVACHSRRGDTGEEPEADVDCDAGGDVDVEPGNGCPDDAVPEDWPEEIDDVEVHLAWGGHNSALGDVNGDGYDDIALDDALVLLGPLCPGLFPDDEDLIRAELSVPSGFGYQRLDGAGDVDRDGLADFLVGDMGMWPDYASEVFLALSPVAGEVYLPDVAAAEIVGETERGYFGEAVAGVGDVDGDCVPDLLVGAQYEDDDGGLRNGAAWLFSGTTRGYHAASEVGVAIRGSEEYPTVGYNLAALGDTDGDGLADFLVGTHAGPLEKAVALFRGPVAANLAFEDADALFLAHPDDEYGGSFGSAISSAGDQDGDGLPEIAIGASVMTLLVDGEGAVYLFEGSNSGVFDRTGARSALEGEAEGDGAGTAVDLAGDVNGDGQADLVIGADGFDSETSLGSVGAVYVLLGPIAEGSQSLAGADVRVVGTFDEQGQDLGYYVIGAGDTNGDRLDDVLVAGWMDVGDHFYHSHLLLGRW